MFKWNVKEKYKKGMDVVEAILKNRGFQDRKAVKEFLEVPKLQDFWDKLPKEFKETLRKSANIIKKAIKDEKTILIHGDYDADGVCATAILFNTITKGLNYKNVIFYIPNRFEHGYGLSKGSINTALEKVENPEESILVITVDSGITANEEVKYLKDMGHEVIITDHHQKPQKLPSAEEIVWSDEVVGSTIVWLLSNTLGVKDKDHLALAAIATITDLQPVLGLNRFVVKKGLEVMNKTPPLGIEKLLLVSGKETDDLTTYDLGWIIGPRLNASGRMDDALDSVRLLTETDEKIIENIAKKLDEINQERQESTIKMYEIAEKEKFSEQKIIISQNEKYHEGIIGLVASRLTKKYYKPSVVISLNEHHGKGSVRSIPGVDIISILRQFEELFVDLGGHPMAAGFTVTRNNVNKLEQTLNDHFDEIYEEDLYKRVLDIDLLIPLNVIDLQFINKLEALKPYGIGNEEPVFAAKNAGVAELKAVGKDSNHLSMRLFDGENFYKAIYFNGVEKSKNILVGDNVDIAFMLRKNEYGGRTYIDLVIKDIVKL